MVAESLYTQTVSLREDDVRLSKFVLSIVVLHDVYVYDGCTYDGWSTTGRS